MLFEPVFVPPVLWISFAVIWGLCLGSFTTCVVYRIPRGISIWREQSGSYRSFCPACQTPLRLWDLVPAFSWLALGGRCRYCRTRIPARYVLIELAVLCLVTGMALLFGCSLGFFVMTPLIPAVFGLAAFFSKPDRY